MARPFGGSAGYWVRAVTTIVGWDMAVVAAYAVAVSVVLQVHPQQRGAPGGGRLNAVDTPGWEPFVALLLIVCGVITLGLMIGVSSSLLYRRVYSAVHGPAADRPHAFRLANQVALRVLWPLALATAVVWSGLAVLVAALGR